MRKQSQWKGFFDQYGKSGQVYYRRLIRIASEGQWEKQWRSSLRILGGAKLALSLVCQVYSLHSTIAAVGSLICDAN